MHQESMKSFITHIMWFSGETRGGSQAGPEVALETGEMLLAWTSTVVRGGAAERIPMHRPGLA